MTHIYDWALWGCTSLKSLDLNNAWVDYDKLQLDIIEHLVMGATTSVGGFGYANNFPALKTVVIPESVITIEPYTFSDCNNLQTIIIENASVEIGEQAFSYCENLNNVDLGDQVRYIRDRAFYECRSLEKIEIPGSVIEIGCFAFSDCDSLCELILNEGLHYIGDGAFIHIPITELTIPSTVLDLGYGDGDPNQSEYGSTFSGCDKLTSVTILSDYISRIPYACFSGSNIQAITLPRNLLEIEDYAFSSTSLTSITIPAGVQRIGTYAFVSCYSLTNVIFLGNSPDMDSAFYCSSFNIAGFYPKHNSTWEDAGNIMAGACIDSAVAYTLNGENTICPELPSEEERDFWLREFQNYVYPTGMTYPDNYHYIINGNFLTGYGEEAFAFELSDALYGYLPISNKRNLIFDKLNLGDILYFEDEVCVVTELLENGIKVAGVDEKNSIYYDRTLTKSDVMSALSYRTRCGVSPYPGVTDPAMDFELTNLPTDLPTEQQVYDKILALQDIFPEGMPWSSKNHFASKTESPTVYVNGVPSHGLNMTGHGCSAFGYLASDVCFGNRPVRYVSNDQLDYDSIMVGDNLLSASHQVVVLEVYNNCLIIAEGNYNGMMHWGRILTREEVEEGYDLFTRYPEGTVAPKRGYYDIPEEPEETIPPTTEPEDTVPPTTEPEETVPPTTEPVETEPTKPTVPEVTEPIKPSEPEETEPTNPNEPEQTEPTNPYEPEDTDPTDPPCEHRWTQWEVTSPTSEKEGLRTRACEICGEEKTEVLPKLSGAFKDVKETEYYALPVDWAVQKNITTGVGEGKFAPNDNCTRGQIVTFLWRAAGEPEPTSSQNPFKDVRSTDYFYKAVLWAVEKGITTGTDATHFSPEESCTRGQVATFLWRTLNKPDVSGVHNPFVDVTQAAFYYAPVLWAVQAKVTNGTDDTHFSPEETCTRGQIVTFLYRALG